MRSSRADVSPSLSGDSHATARGPARPDWRRPARALSGGTLLLAWYTATLFVSAFLLFLVQPMFAKMVLPMLGGTPAVWNTCMVFFQAMLLAGYGYVHAATAWLGARRQSALHVILLLSPLLTLPIRVSQGSAPPAQQNPLPWLLWILLASVGLPFFVVSASAPMLQKWFASTGHPSAKDPYFLYGASNLGSMLALLSYPGLVEPNLRLSEQGWLWAGGYGLLVMLTVGCAAMVWRRPPIPPQDLSLGALRDPQGRSSVFEGGAGPTAGRRARWVALSFVPSSLMLGVTTYLTTEIPAIPLFWVVPLGLYLVTFILVFARKPLLPHTGMVRALPFAILPLAICIPLQVIEPLWLFIPLHLAAFFVAAMICHGALAESRPPTEYLTEFYLWISVGGVLGGLFNALVAPMAFKGVVEYPLAMVLACLLRPRTDPEGQTSLGRWLDIGLPLSLGVLVAGLLRGADASRVKSGPLLAALVLGPALVCFAFRRRPIRFGLGVGAIMLATVSSLDVGGRVLHAERSFFGVHRVKQDAEGKYHLLVHGRVVHGGQSLDPNRRREPLAYYFPTGPIGQVFAALAGASAKPQVAIVGLGTGSMACYGEPGQHFTFYEIDPVVEHLARDPRYFTFLQECGSKPDVVLGDARRSLVRAPDRHYGLIILDAFSADVIPVHLLTREAIELYVAKLADGGVIAFHISNRHLDLGPVLGDLARDAGLASLAQLDLHISEAELKRGKMGSWWVVMARRPEDFGGLARDPRWHVLPGRRGAKVWSDDFSNILRILKWK